MGLVSRVGLAPMITYAKCQLNIFHSIQVIRLRKTLTKGQNSWINASRIMGLVSRVGLMQMNMRSNANDYVWQVLVEYLS